MWEQNNRNCLQKMDSEYSLEEGIIMKGLQVVIPVGLQQKISRELHDTHSGIVNYSKALVRSYLWWSKIDQEIELIALTTGLCVFMFMGNYFLTCD